MNFISLCCNKITSQYRWGKFTKRTLTTTPRMLSTLHQLIIANDFITTFLKNTKLVKKAQKLAYPALKSLNYSEDTPTPFSPPTQNADIS